MLKITPEFVLLLFGLLHYVSCDKLEVDENDYQLMISKQTGSCQEYFQYQFIGHFLTGKLTVPHMEIGDTVKITFYRDIELGQNFSHGILLPVGSSQKVINRLRRKQPISYRIDFPVVNYNPVLLNIFINNNRLCVGGFDYTYDDIFTFEHTLNIVNGFVQVYTYNINMPHFVEAPNASSGLVDREITTCGGTTSSLKDICGRSNTEYRIEHPWFAAIYRKLLTGELFYCTGTIVSSRSVLMPANCIARTFAPGYIRVYFGRYDLSNIYERGVVFRHMEGKIFHSELDPLHHDNSIALLHMKDPIVFNQYVAPICLWSEPREQLGILEHSITLSGWIITDVRKEISTVPKSMEVNIAPLAQCQLLGHSVSTTSNDLCIPRDENMTGRILMMKRSGRWLLLGGCSYFHDSDNFCLLTDIVEKNSWIQRNMLS